MQCQAHILGIPVDVPVVTDSTALGAAYMAAYGIGEIGTLETVERNWKRKKRYEPKISAEERSRLLKGWHRAVERVKGWMIEEEKENADV